MTLIACHSYVSGLEYRRTIDFKSYQDNLSHVFKYDKKAQTLHDTNPDVTI